ncbi:hypothetical protein APY04_0022 [Hyphomicrobium sulfonivorans]|uniref:Uncharacterized protein n=1 Tax=Hyphomicrobium sulfonivorans TaxID=121290 RepID=A0A120CYS3_HYPSL|nr:hypothetical protein APY04_0022 [Hyphomicrobium sulfonivorans]
MFSFPAIDQISDELIQASRLQKAMIFEIAMARAEQKLDVRKLG